MSESELNAATILVADDNWANLELLSELLQVLGYRVVCVADGEQALEALRADQIDLALLDVMMPCRTIKSKPETRLIPVVLVTGLTDSGDRIQGIEAGADDFLGKPVNKEELLARVRSLLRLKQFTDELENAETVLFSLALSIASRHRGAHLCPAEILPPRPTYHPLPPREARWIGISRRTERRGDPPDRPDPANGGHL